MKQPISKPDLSDLAVLLTLPPRPAIYWKTLEFCRHIGFLSRGDDKHYWQARVRLHEGGYRQRRLGLVAPFHSDGLNYQQAVEIAYGWFGSEEIQSIAAVPYPVGVNATLKYEKRREGFTIGDAMHDYVEWKRVAAAKTYFHTSLSLINHHIIPRLGDHLVADFTARDLTEFCRDVLETAPKRGLQRPRANIRLEDLPLDALRKRKKTVNTLIGILRLAFRMAWENGEIESDRAWRCLRRLPHLDTPRHYFLTRPQCHRLVAACPPALQRLVLGALYTGCRVSELAQMKVRDVGVHVFGVYVAPLKSFRGRYVFLPETGMSFFLDQCEGKDEEDFVFLMDSGKPWGGGHKHLFRGAVRAAELPAGFVFHGLRHTYASQLVQAGTPLAVVAKQLGHANTDTVSRTYGHLSCQTIEEELAKRFAPLESKRFDVRLEGLRDSLQSAEVDAPSWPRSNFSQASDDVVALLRSR